jgi:hypothetical protein
MFLPDLLFSCSLTDSTPIELMSLSFILIGMLSSADLPPCQFAHEISLVVMTPPVSQLNILQLSLLLPSAGPRYRHLKLLSAVLALILVRSITYPILPTGCAYNLNGDLSCVVGVGLIMFKIMVAVLTCNSKMNP